MEQRMLKTSALEGPCEDCSHSAASRGSFSSTWTPRDGRGFLWLWQKPGATSGFLWPIWTKMGQLCPVSPAPLPACVHPGRSTAGAWLYLVQGPSESRRLPGSCQEEKVAAEAADTSDNSSLVASWGSSQFSDPDGVSQVPSGAH